MNETQMIKKYKKILHELVDEQFEKFKPRISVVNPSLEQPESQLLLVSLCSTNQKIATKLLKVEGDMVIKR